MIGSDGPGTARWEPGLTRGPDTHGGVVWCGFRPLYEIKQEGRGPRRRMQKGCIHKSAQSYNFVDGGMEVWPGDCES